ncbi:hypothetical protein ADUPG1_010567, partial [Aduncisulcus paluster]
SSTTLGHSSAHQLSPSSTSDQPVTSRGHDSSTTLGHSSAHQLSPSSTSDQPVTSRGHDSSTTLGHSSAHQLSPSSTSDQPVTSRGHDSSTTLGHSSAHQLSPSSTSDQPVTSRGPVAYDQSSPSARPAHSHEQDQAPPLNPEFSESPSLSVTHIAPVTRSSVFEDPLLPMLMHPTHDRELQATTREPGPTLRLSEVTLPAEIKDGMLRDLIESIQEAADIDRMMEILIDECTRRWKEELISRKRNTLEATEHTSPQIPRRIERIEDLPDTLPPSLTMSLHYCITSGNIPMINRILDDYRRTVLAASDKYRLQRLAKQDIAKAIQPEEEEEAPPGMGTLIMDHLSRPNTTDTSSVPVPEISTLDRFTIHAFTLAEVKQGLTKVLKTSAGPDKMTGRAIQTVPPEIWRLFFNAILTIRKIPDGWMESRLTLVDKDVGKENKRDADTQGRWRPICISNTSQRAFYSVIARRLTTYATSHGLIGGYQRGFIPGIDGCALNIMETREWLAANTSHCAACLDLSDAYGSVSHTLLRRIIENTVHISSTEVIEQSISSIILDNDNSIPTERGMAQGNAISPVLFNMALDSVIPTELKTHIRAFADDIIVLGSSQSELTSLTDRLCAALDAGGFTLNADKCFTIGCNEITSDIGVITAGDIEKQKYLGLAIPVSEPMRLATSRKTEQVLKEIERVLKLPLKPLQKVIAFNEHLLPKLVYYARLGLIPQKKLSYIDTLVRAAVSKQLHLPSRGIPTAFYHVQQRSGGLGIAQSTMEVDMYRVSLLIHSLTYPALKAAFLKFMENCHMEFEDGEEHQTLRTIFTTNGDVSRRRTGTGRQRLININWVPCIQALRRTNLSLARKDDIFYITGFNWKAGSK